MLPDILTAIHNLADHYSARLQAQIAVREKEMEADDTSHHLVYRVLGVSDAEGRLIDLYQNKGRFLYKYAGAFLEAAAITCIQHRFPDSKKVKIPNTQSSRPKMVEIDCLVASSAYEIKWRDATTDGDHITKEHTRVRVIKDHGYTPVRLMFYEPQREQAKRIQETLRTLYHGVGGEYYYGDSAWCHLRELTGVDLQDLLNTIVHTGR